jgi:predicted DNA-binding transcriptional regulator AlpA
MTLKEVCRFFGGSAPLHPATIYRGIGLRYPQPVKIGPNSNRWLRTECEAALLGLADERRSWPAIKPDAKRAIAAKLSVSQASSRNASAKAKKYRRAFGDQSGGTKLPTREKTKRPKESSGDKRERRKRVVSPTLLVGN